MVYTRDWLEVNPVDHTKFSAQPGNVRSHKVDISDRLKAMFKGFVSGETQTDEGIIKLPFNVQGSDPGAEANKVVDYAKDVSAKAERFMQDEDGNVIQITTGGKLNGNPNPHTEKTTVVAADQFIISDSAASNVIKKILMSTIGKFMYPVGFVITLGVATNPNTLFGFGTWTAIAGKVIVGIDAGQSEFDTLDETGGAKTHTLAESEIPAHTHSVAAKDNGIANAGAGNAISSNVSSGSITSGSTGGGGAHNNLQPYIVKYVWQRTA